MNEPRHRLAAVWFADIVDYSRLSAVDEAEALRLVEIFQSVVKESVEKYDGRVVKFLGDGVLAEFPSTQSAVRAGIDLQKEYTKRTAESPPGDGHSLRVGIHVGDVAQMPDGDLYGDGVNIGARLQQAAAAGQVVISEDVWRQIRQRPEFEFTDLGQQELKGALGPMTIYGVEIGEGLGSRTSTTGVVPRRFSVGRSKSASHHRRNIAYLGAGFAFAIVTVGATMFFMQRDQPPPPPPGGFTPEVFLDRALNAISELEETQRVNEAQRQRIEELNRIREEQGAQALGDIPGLAEEMEELNAMLEGLQELEVSGVAGDSLAALGVTDSIAKAIEAAGAAAQPPEVDREQRPPRPVPPADRRRPPGQRP